MVSRHLPSIFSAEMERNPFFHSLHKEIDRVFDRFRDRDTVEGEDLFAKAGHRITPALDIAETDTAVEVTAELPGVLEKDLEISITGGVLTLKGEKTTDREEKEKDYHLVERRYGSFRRSIPLGFEPEDGKVEAKFADGILRLKIEKPETAVAKTQTIKIAKS